MNDEDYKQQLIAATQVLLSQCPILDESGIEMGMEYKDFVAMQEIKAKCCHDIFNKFNESDTISIESFSALISALLHSAKANGIDPFELIMNSGDDYLHDIASTRRDEVK